MKWFILIIIFVIGLYLFIDYQMYERDLSVKTETRNEIYNAYPTDTPDQATNRRSYWNCIDALDAKIDSQIALREGLTASQQAVIDIAIEQLNREKDKCN